LVETVNTGLGAVARKLALDLGVPPWAATITGWVVSNVASRTSGGGGPQAIRVVGIALCVEHGDLGLVDCSSVAEPPRYRPGRTARPRSRDGNLRQSAVTKWWVRRQSPCCAAFVGHNPGTILGTTPHHRLDGVAGARHHQMTARDDEIPVQQRFSSAYPGASPGVRVEPGT
jgi:hypothetical protein